MNIYKLAVDFFTKRAERDEKKRRIEYDLPAELKSLESAKFRTEGRVYIEEFKEGIEKEKRELVKLNDELLGIIEQITPLLRKVNATRLNPLITEVGNKIFFDVWLDEEGIVQASGHYDKIN